MICAESRTAAEDGDVVLRSTMLSSIPTGSGALFRPFQHHGSLRESKNASSEAGVTMHALV